MNDLHSEGNFEDVSKYKFAQAEDDLDTARILIQAEKYKAANNRAYYACFHAISAVLALEPIAFRRHKDVLAHFNKKYVHGGIFPKEVGRKVSGLELIRHKSDYDTFYIASKDDAIVQVESAAYIIGLIKQYLEERSNACNGKTVD